MGKINLNWMNGHVWELKSKGLKKQTMSVNVTKFDKPNRISTVGIIVNNVENLDGRASNILAIDKQNHIQKLEMNSSLTPVDCYIELLVQEMFLNEQSLCSIKTANGKTISFELTLKEIQDSKEIYKLNVSEMYKLALRCKENGVIMFKMYPLFAHEYFSFAAKTLISYKPFDVITLKEDGVAGEDLQSLFIQIQTNLAACLLIEQRYEDVIYHTEFVETIKDPSEKSIYRRAMAFFYIKEFESAQQLIEKVPQYAEKKDFVKLLQRVSDSRKASNAHYKHVIQRMFN